MGIKKFQSLCIPFLSDLLSIGAENEQNSISVNAVLRISKLFKQIIFQFKTFQVVYGPLLLVQPQNYIRFCVFLAVLYISQNLWH